jgi:hypothetical protein
MPDGEVATTRVVKSARPWSGLVLGILLGLSIAIVLQQAGIWPLDRLLLFGSAGLFAVIGILLSGAGRQRVGAFSSVVPLLLAVALLAFGATGLGEINETGELNGGCTVQAVSDLDGTVVTDTSRQDPFDIDPDGALSWTASSPQPITNHLWEIHVDLGGFPVTLADNEEPEPNTDQDLENSGDVSDLNAYIDEVTEFAGLELAGILEVGGSIDGEGGACDGFGFVRLVADPLTTLIAQIAAGVGALTLIGLLVLAFNRTREAEVVTDDELGDANYAEVGASPDETGGSATGATGVRGAHERLEEAPPPSPPPAPADQPGTDDEEA